MRHPFIRFSRAAAAAAVLLGAASAFAQTVVSGKDPGVSSRISIPNSDAAAATFAAALTGSTLITFESGNTNVQNGSAGNGFVGTVTNNGVGISLTNSGGITVRGNPGGSNLGFNTTVGAAGNGNRLNVESMSTSNPMAVTFDFSPTPINAFGAYFTGVGTDSGILRLNFVSGGFQTFNLSNLIGDANGGAAFFGVYGITPPISTVTLTLGPRSGDIFSVDDIRFQRVVPEPSVWLAAGVFGLGVIGLMVRGRRGSTRGAADYL